MAIIRLAVPSLKRRIGVGWAKGPKKSNKSYRLEKGARREKERRVPPGKKIPARKNTYTGRKTTGEAEKGEPYRSKEGA